MHHCGIRTNNVTHSDDRFSQYLVSIAIRDAPIPILPIPIPGIGRNWLQLAVKTNRSERSWKMASTFVWVYFTGRSSHMGWSVVAGTTTH
jgi:hypothetical protein